MADVMAFYRQDLSTFALTVWWQACERFDLEQVRKVMTAHAMDPEHGRFAPRPADVIRLLQGTATDRSLLAWGKVMDAAQRVGAYTSVAFDDPVIHAVIEDLGGWVLVCRAGVNELPFLQRRFCDGYKAYANRGGDIQFPALLLGEHEQCNRHNGQPTAAPMLIGNAVQAMRVLEQGATGPKTAITAADAVIVPALAVPSLRALDVPGRGAGDAS
ncbi:MAG: DUF6475 domain-containing protein [Burkholderiales bacterium]